MMITNPDWLAARYEMRFQLADGRLVDDVPHRFDELPPEDLRGEAYITWILEHSIPRYVEVKEKTR
jgi:hypothetical protein